MDNGPTAASENHDQHSRIHDIEEGWTGISNLVVSITLASFAGSIAAIGLADTFNHWLVMFACWASLGATLALALGARISSLASPRWWLKLRRAVIVLTACGTLAGFTLLCIAIYVNAKDNPSQAKENTQIVQPPTQTQGN